MIKKFLNKNYSSIKHYFTLESKFILEIYYELELRNFEQFLFGFSSTQELSVAEMLESSSILVHKRTIKGTSK